MLFKYFLGKLLNHYINPELIDAFYSTSSRCLAKSKLNVCKLPLLIDPICLHSLTRFTN